MNDAQIFAAFHLTGWCKVRHYFGSQVASCSVQGLTDNDPTKGESQRAR